MEAREWIDASKVVKEDWSTWSEQMIFERDYVRVDVWPLGPLQASRPLGHAQNRIVTGKQSY